MCRGKWLPPHFPLHFRPFSLKKCRGKSLPPDFPLQPRPLQRKTIKIKYGRATPSPFHRKQAESPSSQLEGLPYRNQSSGAASSRPSFLPRKTGSRARPDFLPLFIKKRKRPQAGAPLLFFHPSAVGPTPHLSSVGRRPTPHQSPRADTAPYFNAASTAFETARSKPTIVTFS